MEDQMQGQHQGNGQPYRRSKGHAKFSYLKNFHRLEKVSYLLIISSKRGNQRDLKFGTMQKIWSTGTGMVRMLVW